MMAECPCTNISIMQLFHELKQKFPAIPDRVVNECIRQNGHDKGACEWILEKENRSYLLHSYPPGLLQGAPPGPRMSLDGGGCHGPDPARPDDRDAFDRRLPGRQSLDSSTRRQQQLHQKKNVTFRHYSDEYLDHPSGVAPRCEFVLEDSPLIARLPPLLCHTSYSSDADGYWATDRRLIESPSHHSCCSRRTSSSSYESAGASFQSGGELYGSRGSCQNEGGPPSNRDLKLELAAASDNAPSCRCERTSVSVVSSYAERRALPSLSAPVTPCGCAPPLFPLPLTVDVTTRRHRTALSVDPAPPYLGQQQADVQRPFTRVNLTLRPPSADPQPPIDIRSAGGGLTYSTCSYDPRQGFQSRLQISIGPGGRGSVSAARTNTCSTPVLRSATSMPDVATTSSLLHVPDGPDLDISTQALVNKQLEQKQRLERELQKEKEKLQTMQQDVEAMEQRLSRTAMPAHAPARPTRVQELRDEILRLREECKRMTSEVDQSNVPLGETSEEFYRHIYTGQRGTCLVVPSSSSANVPDRGFRISAADLSSSEQRGAAGGDGPSWTCHVCTFRNHPLLDKCEQCEMPRIVLGTAPARAYPSAALTKAQPHSVH